ncbi:thioredoxin domain-containing protein [Brevundimonas sp.]|uniref:DsbA family protein n=1 Tax=Brevundimonas sp. TaxID=1871086 RepID=UPI0025FE648E|nr:thioredoxin domain-containing protein [Brevundimonas sp.]
MTEETPPPEPAGSRSILDSFNPGWAALIVALLALILAATPYASGGLTPQVRKALLNNPEILREASQLLQERELAQIQAAARETIAQNLPQLERDPRDPVIGPDDAPVTVIQFFDYRCPYCKQIAGPYMELVRANPDIRFVFKEWPILDRDEPLSEYAARAALAAEEQGRYAQVHQALMAAETIDNASVDATLAQAGVDLAEARTFISAQETGQHLTDVMRLAQMIGASGTPTFIVDGEMIEVRSPQDLQAAIDRAREGGSPRGQGPALRSAAGREEVAAEG